MSFAEQNNNNNKEKTFLVHTSPTHVHLRLRRPLVTDVDTSRHRDTEEEKERKKTPTCRCGLYTRFRERTHRIGNRRHVFRRLSDDTTVGLNDTQTRDSRETDRAREMDRYRHRQNATGRSTVRQVERDTHGTLPRRSYDGRTITVLLCFSIFTPERRQTEDKGEDGESTFLL